jgi:general secretion pathway protein H
MGNPVAKGRMPTSVPGNERCLPRLPRPCGGLSRDRAEGGFTLIELLLVVALIAIASGLAALAVRDPATTRLEQEAARLSALLESARGDARAFGLTVTWRPLAKDDSSTGTADFRFDGLPPIDPLPTNWLAPGVTAEVVGAPALVLGPEPMIAAQSVTLSLDKQRTTLATDGLGPFVAVAEDESGARR